MKGVHKENHEVASDGVLLKQRHLWARRCVQGRAGTSQPQFIVFMAEVVTVGEQMLARMLI